MKTYNPQSDIMCNIKTNKVINLSTLQKIILV